ncbi:MAG: GGDEF domain-containing protein [Lachnospiraceae bacterium]|nr:GGDEF domain-containing protein [Lachnospiraceae bacterium]
MNSKNFFKEQKNLIIVQRMLYLVLAFYLLILYAMEIEFHAGRTVVFVGIIFAVSAIEELLVYFNCLEKQMLMSIWRFIQYLLALVSLYAVFDYPYATIAQLGLLILYIIEFVMLGDVFDTYSNVVRFVILFIPLVIFVVAMGNMSHGYRWVWVLFSAVILYLIIIKLLVFVSRIIKLYDKELNEKNIILSEAEDTNQKLLEYQERIKTVNTALNLQKLDLERANQRIKNANDEITVQAEIAKFIAGSFDAAKIINTISEGIISTKDICFCAIYVDKMVYLNKHANCIIKSEDSGLKRRLNRDLPDIFRQYKVKYADTIIDNELSKDKYPFIGDSTVKSIILRPLQLDNGVYGIIMVGNASENFTNENLSFYDALIAQLNVAVNNCKLYLQTQDMARKDGLTGINNRTYFNTLYGETVKQMLSNKTPMCVALFDIDKFKRVNDTYGHLAGDEVIKTVASLTETHIERHNGFVCRYGGEEFVAVLPGVQIKDAEKIINELHAIIADSVVEYGGERIGINVSVGLTAYPEIRDNPYDLLKHADWAMYYAKEHGRGQVKVDGDDVESYN